MTKTTTAPLSPVAWIEAAFAALRAGGVPALRIEAMARDLQVSKGSFYWHFKDLAALKAAMLQHWADDATARVIALVDAGADAPEARLRQLVATATLAPRQPGDEAASEQAIREWARYDAAVAACLAQVDTRRLDYVARLFRGCGQSAARSRRHAQLLYGALIGLGYLGASTALATRAALQTQLALLLAPAAPPQACVCAADSTRGG